MALEYPIEIAFRVTPRMMMRAAWINMFKGWWRKLSPVIMVAAIALLSLTSGDGWSLLELVLGVMVALYLFIFVYTVLVWPFVQFRRTGPLQQEMKFVFDPDRFEAVSAAGASSQSWLYAVTATKDLLLMYVGSSVYMILPASACASEEQYGEVVRLAQRFAEHK